MSKNAFKNALIKGVSGKKSGVKSKGKRRISNRNKKKTKKDSFQIKFKSQKSAQKIQSKIEEMRPSFELEPMVAPPVSQGDKNLQDYPNPLVTGRQLTITDIIRPKGRIKDSFEAFIFNQRSDHTKRAYGQDLKKLIRFLLVREKNFGDVPFDRLAVVAFKASLQEDGLSDTSVDRALATVKSLFSWLCEEGWVDRNPAEFVKFLKPKRLSSTKGFSDDEVIKILSLQDLTTKTGSLHHAILMVLFYCGLRRSECCQLKTSHIDEEKEQKFFRVEGKGKVERIIPIVPSLWKALEHHFKMNRLKLDDDEFLFSPVRNNRSGTKDKALDDSMLFYIVKKYAKLAGIQKKVSPHSCRATAISNARDHQVSDRKIQEFAGWSSPDMITRYDKRKTALQNSAALSISYEK